MNVFKGSKLAKVLVAVLGLTVFTGSMPALAQTLPPPPDKPAAADTVNPVTAAAHRDDSSHDGGWLALFGLAVLLGLLQRPELHMRHRNTTRSSRRRPD